MTGTCSVIRRRPTTTPVGMKRSLVVEFTKMHGAGNDFLVIDNRFFKFSEQELATIATRYCPRHLGIGADGLLALERGTDGADYRMRYRNADGSLGTMCGNGARCLAVFAEAAGLGTTAPLVFDTDAGRHLAAVHADRDEATIWLPEPHPDLSFTSERLANLDVIPVWTGTQHAVCFVPAVDEVDLPTLGRRIRFDEAFLPGGTNVDFVEIPRQESTTDAGRIRVRTYEKGVESETLACGTGALAAGLVSLVYYFPQAAEIEVSMPGGRLTVGVARSDDGRLSELTLRGPVATVFRGTFELQL